MLDYGDQQKIADAAGIAKSTLSDILRRRRRAGVEVAERLEAASTLVLGKDKTIPWTEFVRSKTSKNECFKENPVYKLL